MLSILIIEDELPNAVRLEKMLTSIEDDIEIIGYLQTVQDSIEWLRSHPHPDLICMDIRLTDGLSFDIFNQVKICSKIIFTTAYDEYALKAFEVNGVDYLLKPVQPDKLIKSIKKVKTALNTTDNAILLDTLKKIHKREHIYRSRFLVSYRDMYIMIAVTDIAYFTSENKSTFLVTYSSTRYVVEQTLEELEQELDPNLFFRISRQFIISLKSINKIHQSFNGKLRIELMPPTSDGILASRDKSASLKKWLDQS